MTSNNTFNYKRRNLGSGLHLLGSLLIVAGIFVLVSPTFLVSGSSVEKIVGVGVGALIIGPIVISSYSGIFIDFKGKRYKEYSTIAGYKLGEWTWLPTILTVKVISASYVGTNTPNGISPTLSGKVTDFKIIIYSDDSEPVLSFVFSSERKALRNAKSLASNLNAKLVINISERK